MNLFSTNVINDGELQKMKAKKVKVLNKSVSCAASQASHSTAESANLAGKTNLASSDFPGAADTKLFSFAKTNSLAGNLQSLGNT